MAAAEEHDGARFQDVFTQSGVAQAIVGVDGTIAAVNEATCVMFDRTADELIGQHLLERLPEDGRDEDARRLQAVLSGELSRTQFERRLDHKNGGWIDALVSVAPVCVPGSHDVHEVSICLQDISELKAAQDAALRAEARWRSLSQNASDIAMLTDQEFRVDYASPSLAAMLGHPANTLDGQPLLSLAHPDDRARVSAALQRAVATPAKDRVLTFRMQAADGSWRQVEQRVVNLLHDADVQRLVVNLRDVSEQHELQQTILRTSMQDGLTGLPNRALLLDRVEQAIERERATGTPYALMFVNVDRLQGINEAFGHSTGDEVLRCVADTLFGTVRPADTVARYSGDEFAVLLQDVRDRRDVEATAQRTTEALSSTLLREGEAAVKYTACVGLAFGPATTAEALLSAGEAAMNGAKAHGRGRMMVVEDLLQHRVHDRRQLGGQLAAAVSANALAVHYQPVVNLTTGCISGFEALVRWPHPERGLLTPGDFLPLAEALGLQVPIDEWVLRQACRTAQTWTCAAGESPTVAVNIAPAQLISATFADVVERVLGESGLAPDRLVLEVTETAVVADLAAAEAVLRKLSELGVRVAIDDFGTGYSSMLQLRQLPFDKLKIDREFVRGLPDSRDDMAICSSVISLSSRLGVRSIAEGVETASQAATLAALGCGYGQGFLWSPAVPATEAERLLEAPTWPPGPPGAVARRTSRTSFDDDPSLTEQIRQLHESGASLSSIAAKLNGEGHRTAQHKRWHPATVARVLYRASR